MVAYNEALVQSLLASDFVRSTMNGFSGQGHRGLVHIYTRPNDQSTGGAEFTWHGGSVGGTSWRPQLSFPLTTINADREIKWDVKFRDDTGKKVHLKCRSTIPGTVSRNTGALIVSEAPYAVLFDEDFNVLKHPNVEMGVQVECSDVSNDKEEL